MTNKTIYLPGLNGLRAIASLAVVVSHITLNLRSFGLSPYIFGVNSEGGPRSLDMAGFGVSIFFTLSGFLITFLLLKEKEINKINIKKFYFRRLLRIWPLYYTYLILCFLVYYLFNLTFSGEIVLYYVFFSANIPFVLGASLPFLYHFWSLAVEEQFYIFWPWINRLSIHKLILFILAFISLMLLLKVSFHVIKPGSITEQFIHVSRFHCMMIGALGAILFYLKNNQFIKILSSRLVQLISWFVFILILINKFHIVSILDNEIISFITVAIIVGQITSTSFVKLENSLFDFLGKISYGVYVIHPLLIFLFSKILYNVTPSKPA